MSIYEVSVEHSFSARHAIRLPDGSWEPSHGHGWHVTATFRADRLEEPSGVVVDFLDVQRALQQIAGELGGTDLNTLADFEGQGASAERLAEYLARRLGNLLETRARLYRLAVVEAPGCSAAFYPDTGADA